MRAVGVLVPSVIALAACHRGNLPAQGESKNDSALAAKRADSIAARLQRQLEQCHVSSKSGSEMTKCLVQFDWSADSAQTAGQAYQVALDIAYRDDLAGRIRSMLTTACMSKDSVDAHVRE